MNFRKFRPKDNIIVLDMDFGWPSYALSKLDYKSKMSNGEDSYFRNFDDIIKPTSSNLTS